MTKGCVVIGCDWGGLGVLEDLHAAGVDTLAVRTRPQEFADRSRFAGRRMSIPLTDPASEDLVGALCGAKEWHGSSLVATTDVAVAYVARHRDALAKHFHFTTQDWETTSALLDKRDLYRRARELGIPRPETIDDTNGPESTSRIAALGFPVIVKPRRSPEFFARFRSKMFVARDAEQLRLALDLAGDAGLSVVASEIIPGDDDNLFQYRVYVDRDGRVLAEVCTQKLRQHPPGFGCARVLRTVSMVEEIRSASLRLLETCGYRGLAQVEFKWDERDARYKLIEVNLRPPMTQRLYRAAGVNFPHLMHLDCVEGVSRVLSGYETDVHWIDLFMDPPGWFRWRHVERRERGRYFAPYAARRVFNVRPFSDPIPFLAKTWILARHAPDYVMSRRDEVVGPILSSRVGPATAARQSGMSSRTAPGEWIASKD